MFIYAFWPRNGHQMFQAFHKEDKATDFVIAQINALTNTELRKNNSSKDIPKELAILNDYMKIIIAEKIKTLTHATKAIELYEEYLKYVPGYTSLIHTLEDLKIVE